MNSIVGINGLDPTLKIIPLSKKLLLPIRNLLSVDGVLLKKIRFI